jgi:hypothetical protein
MKRLFLILAGADPTYSRVGTGVWKVVSSDTTREALIVKNDVPVQDMEDWGGYNIVDYDANTTPFPNATSISVKQYTSHAAEFALTPPAGCLKNYRTLEEAGTAFENQTNVQGVMLYDNL